MHLRTEGIQKNLYLMKIMQESIKSVCGLWSLIILGITENLRQIKVTSVVIGSEVTVTDAMVSVFFKLLSVFSKFYTKQVNKNLKRLNSV